MSLGIIKNIILIKPRTTKHANLEGLNIKRLCLVHEYPNGKSGCISNVKNTRARSFEGELVKEEGGVVYMCIIFV